VTLEPAVVKRAKAVARARDTNLSAMIEELLLHATTGGQKAPGFVARWAGKLELRDHDADDARYNALAKKYGLDKR
jgi:hypothetical protein